MESGNGNRKLALIILGLILAITSVSLLVIRVPSLKESEPAETEFMMNNALLHLNQIAARPTPMGSEAHDDAKEYLVNQIEELGLDPQIQATSIYNPGWRNAGNIQNIITRIPGSDNSQAILLLSHYDTGHLVPGASNAKAGIATILEYLRVLQSRGSLKNDLIVLFADGGEVGMLGSLAFFEEHPWVDDIGLVINLGAQGTSGPVMMTDSGRFNNWTIPEFKQAVNRPLVNSTINELNRWIIRDNDFAIFKYAGIPGFNLMYGESPRWFQTSMDNIENLDQRSLQQMGDYVDQLVQHFGNLDLAMDSENEEANLANNNVYFDILGLTVVRYPIAFVAHTLTIGLILFGFACWYAIKKEKASLKGIGIGMAILLGTVIVSSIITSLTSRLVLPNHLLYQYIPLNNGLWYFAALVAGVSTVFFLAYNWAYQKLSTLELFLGANIVWVLVTVAVSLLLPGASYGFVWPLILNMIAALIVIVRDDLSWVGETILLGLMALPVLIIWPGLLRILYTSVGYGLLGILIFVVVAILGTLLPQWIKIYQWKRYLLPIMSAGFMIVFVILFLVNAGVSIANPAMDTLVYFLDLDRETAYWISLDDQPSEFTEQVLEDDYSETNLGDFIPYEDMKTISRQVDTELIELIDPITVNMIRDQVDEAVREVTLQLTADADIDNFIVFVEPELLAGDVILNNQVEIEWNEYWPVIRFYNLDADEISLTIPAVVDQPFAIRILTQSFGFPDVGLTSRPEDLIAAPTAITDSLFTIKSYHF